MVFVEQLNPGCYSQLYMVESRMKALQCGILEGVYWSLVIISLLITVIIFRISIGSKNTELEKIKNYMLILICIIFIMLVTFYSISYVNKWNSYQELIQKYRNQGLKNMEIFTLLEIESGRSSIPYISALTSTSLLFLGPKREKDENEKIKNI